MIQNNVNNHYLNDIKELESKYIALILDRLGIIIKTHQITDLVSAVQKACEIFDCTPKEYLERLATCPDQSPLLNHLVTSITVDETYFFRDKKQMELLQHDILPELIRTKRENNILSLRIWSAGCASGEEIYTIAMLLLELIPDIDKWTIKLLATDINTKVLQKAISGTYSEWSMRSIPEYFKNKYFTKNDKRYLLVKKIADFVTFDYLNLNDDTYPSIFNGTNAQDLILCRNVLIYFDEKSCARLMARLCNSLTDSGYLMLGASDPINIEQTNFNYARQRGMIFTKKRVAEHQQIKTTKPTTTITPPIKKPILAKTFAVKATVATQTLTEKTMLLANAGKIEEALKTCEAGFLSEPTNKFNYFNHALILMELNKYAEAEASIRKALFLDNKLVIAHFQLGLLLIRKNQYKAGIKSLQNAINIAEANHPNEYVAGSNGLTYETFAQVLKNEINIHQGAVNHA